MRKVKFTDGHLRQLIDSLEFVYIPFIRQPMSREACQDRRSTLFAGGFTAANNIYLITDIGNQFMLL